MEIRKLPVSEDIPISEVIQMINLLIDGACVIKHYEVHTTEPDKREGTVAFADGSGWNPTGIAGMHEYRGGSWVKL